MCAAAGPLQSRTLRRRHQSIRTLGPLVCILCLLEISDEFPSSHSGCRWLITYHYPNHRWSLVVGGAWHIFRAAATRQPESANPRIREAVKPTEPAAAHHDLNGRKGVLQGSNKVQFPECLAP